MSPFSSISIHTGPSFHRYIRQNGFISCRVSFSNGEYRSLRLGFCLHCKELGCNSWALKHSKQVKADLGVRVSRLFCPEKIDFYKEQIMNDIGFLSEKGKFKTVMSSNEKSIASTINDRSATSLKKRLFRTKMKWTRLNRLF